jgi:hypothetical protein
LGIVLIQISATQSRKHFWTSKERVRDWYNLIFSCSGEKYLIIIFIDLAYFRQRETKEISLCQNLDLIILNTTFVIVMSRRKWTIFCLLEKWCMCCRQRDKKMIHSEWWGTLLNNEGFLHVMGVSVLDLFLVVTH